MVFTSLKEFPSCITNSHEFVDVVDVRGKQGLKLLLSGHIYHLIMLHSVVPAVAVLVEVVVAVEPETPAQAVLLLNIYNILRFFEKWAFKKHYFVLQNCLVLIK